MLSRREIGPSLTIRRRDPSLSAVRRCAPIRTPRPVESRNSSRVKSTMIWLAPPSIASDSAALTVGDVAISMLPPRVTTRVSPPSSGLRSMLSSSLVIFGVPGSAPAYASPCAPIRSSYEASRVVIPADKGVAKEVHAADPAIDRVFLEPICIAREHAPSQGRQRDRRTLALVQRGLSGTQFLEHHCERALAQKRGFFSRLRARKQFVVSRRCLRDRMERLALRARQAVARRRILFAEALQGGA